MKNKVVIFMCLGLIACKEQPIPSFLPDQLEKQTWEWQYSVGPFSSNDTLKRKSDTPNVYRIVKEARNEPTRITYVFLINNQPVAIRYSDEVVSDNGSKVVVLSNQDENEILDLNFPSSEKYNSSKFFIVGFPIAEIDGKKVYNYFQEVQ